MLRGFLFNEYFSIAKIDLTEIINRVRYVIQKYNNEKCARMIILRRKNELF